MGQRDLVRGLFAVAAASWLLPLGTRALLEPPNPSLQAISIRVTSDDRPWTWRPTTAGKRPDAGLVSVETDNDAVPEVGGWRGFLLGIPLDLNQVGLEDLQVLPGIGPAIAAAVVEDRENRGPFSTVDHLERVRGIGPKTLQRLRPFITVAPPAPSSR